jgi:hypothetical protein
MMNTDTATGNVCVLAFALLGQVVLGVFFCRAWVRLVGMLDYIGKMKRYPSVVNLALS